MSQTEIFDGFLIGQRLKGAYASGETAPGSGANLSRDVKIGIAIGLASKGNPYRKYEHLGISLWDWAKGQLGGNFDSAAAYAHYLEQTHLGGIARTDSPYNIVYPCTWRVDDTLPLSYEVDDSGKFSTTVQSEIGGKFTATMTALEQVDCATFGWPFLSRSYRYVNCATIRSDIEVYTVAQATYSLSVKEAGWWSNAWPSVYYTFIGRHASLYGYDENGDITQRAYYYEHNSVGTQKTNTTYQAMSTGERLFAAVDLAAYVPGTYQGREPGSVSTAEGTVRIFAHYPELEDSVIQSNRDLRAGQLRGTLLSEDGAIRKADKPIVTDTRRIYVSGDHSSAAPPTMKCYDPETGGMRNCSSWEYDYDARTYTISYYAGRTIATITLEFLEDRVVITKGEFQKIFYYVKYGK